MRADLARPIDPTSEPLFGFALFKVSADRFFWYARYHHIVMDGLSMALVARRLADVYTKLKVGPAGLGGVFGKLTDLLDEDAAYRTSEQFAEDRQYWLDRLSDRPDRVSLGDQRAGTTGPFVRHTAYLQRADADRLEAVARRCGTSLPQSRGSRDRDLPASPDRRRPMWCSASRSRRAATCRGTHPRWSRTSCRCASRSIRE